MSALTTSIRLATPALASLERARRRALAPRVSAALDGAAVALGRWGLVLLLAWFGIFKWTPTEAAAIQPLLVHSPLTAWLTAITSVQDASIAIGVVELGAAALIALRRWAPLLSAAGSLLAAGTFLTTLTFLATTPGAWAVVDGLVVPGGTGAFLIKDVFLLAAALATAAEAFRAARAERC